MTSEEASLTRVSSPATSEEEELPHYLTEPRVTRESTGILTVPAPQLHFRMQSRKIEYGALIAGDVIVRPNRPYPNVKSLVVTFTLREESRGEPPYQTSFNPLERRKLRLGRTTIEFEEGILKPGFSYAFPFALRMPDCVPRACNKCDDLSRCFHTHLPPSLLLSEARSGVTCAKVEYLLRANIPMAGIAHSMVMRFFPSYVPTNADRLKDVQGKPYIREYGAVQHLGRLSGLLSKLSSSQASVVVSSKAIRHNLASMPRTEVAELDLQFVFQKNQECVEEMLQRLANLTVTHTVYRIVSYSPDGLDNEIGCKPGRRVIKYPICRGESQVRQQSYPRKGGCSLRVTYTLDPRYLQATYVSYMTSVVYEVSFSLKLHGGRRLSVDVPLVLEGEHAPDYDTHIQPLPHEQPLPYECANPNPIPDRKGIPVN